MHFSTTRRSTQFTHRVCLLGRFDFEKISKSILRSLSTAKTKMQIRISVQHWDAWSVAVQRLYSRDENNNEVCVNIIDKIYVLWYSIEKGDMEHNGKLF